MFSKVMIQWQSRSSFFLADWYVRSWIAVQPFEDHINLLLSPFPTTHFILQTFCNSEDQV
jgi:hypothetical protein